MTTTGRPHVIVIGGGMGGLAAAARLAAAGARTTLLERAPHLGGKLRAVEVGGRSIAAGPTVVTMPWVFEELFAACGRRLADHVTLRPLEPACRHFFPDGSRLDLFHDHERTREAIRVFAGEANVRGFDALRRKAQTIFDIVREHFIENALFTSVLSFLRPSALLMAPQMARIDATRTLWRSLSGWFPDERLRALFGRYATYNGSSPFHCPGTLAVIAHVELAYGVHFVEGGIVRLAEAVATLAREHGAELRTGAPVERVVIEQGRAKAVVVNGETLPCDAVVANVEALHLHRDLLAGTPETRTEAARVAALDPSLSAMVLLAVADPGDFPLLHHNVFFSRDYEAEFRALVDERVPPAEPTVYLCAQDRAGESEEAQRSSALHARGRERHLLLSNAPAVAAGEGDARRVSTTRWSEEAPRYRQRTLDHLQAHGLTFRPTDEHLVTPEGFAALFPGSGGALYGAASNSKTAAFERPPNRVPKVKGLYNVGGSCHPGAGVPMVTLSGEIASRQAIEELKLKALPRPKR